jgi:hypothetical protein
MGYNQKSGPLQKAGYNKEATTPFMQDEKNGNGDKKKKDERSGKPQTIGAGKFDDLVSKGIRGEAGGLVSASYLTKAGVPGYEGKEGKWTINEEEGKQIKAYRVSKGLTKP